MPTFKPKPKRKKDHKPTPPVVGDSVRLMRLKPSSARKRRRKALAKLAAAKVLDFHKREREKPEKRRRKNIESREFRWETITKNRLANGQEVVKPVFE